MGLGQPERARVASVCVCAVEASPVEARSLSHKSAEIINSEETPKKVYRTRWRLLLTPL